MKKAAFVLPAIAWMVIILAGAFLLMAFLFRFQISSEFYYAGCDGIIVGQSCFLGVNIEQCGERVGTSLRYFENEEEKEIDLGDSTFLGIAHPRCTRFTDESSCLTAYPAPIEKGAEFISFCNWNEVAPDADGDGTPDNCLVNPEITCSDLSQETTPKCQDVPRCNPISIFKKGLERLLLTK